MASLNKVLLMGNLTRDPDMKYTQGGTAICTLGLAVNRRYQTRQGEDREETCFVDIDVFGRQAELCGNYLRKGAPAFVEGRLRLDQWQDKQTGQNRSKLKVTAQRVQFLGSPGGGANFGDESGSGYSQAGGSQPSPPAPARPQQQPQPQPQPQPQQPAGPPQPQPQPQSPQPQAQPQQQAPQYQDDGPQFDEGDSDIDEQIPF